MAGQERAGVLDVEAVAMRVAELVCERMQRTPQAEWFEVKAAASHAGVTERVMRHWIKTEIPERVIRKMGTRIYLKRSLLDQWLESAR